MFRRIMEMIFARFLLPGVREESNVPFRFFLLLSVYRFSFDDNSSIADISFKKFNILAKTFFKKKKTFCYTVHKKCHKNFNFVYTNQSFQKMIKKKKFLEKYIIWHLIFNKPFFCVPVANENNIWEGLYVSPNLDIDVPRSIRFVSKSG